RELPTHLSFARAALGLPRRVLLGPFVYFGLPFGAFPPLLRRPRAGSRDGADRPRRAGARGGPRLAPPAAGASDLPRALRGPAPRRTDRVNKPARERTILEIVSGHPVGTQEELA